MRRTHPRGETLDAEQRRYLQVASAKRREFYGCNTAELDDIDLTLALAWLAAWWTQRTTNQARRAMMAPETSEQAGLFESTQDDQASNARTR